MNCKVCSNTSAKTPGISFFRFPKEGKKCQKWAELCYMKCSYLKNGPVQFNKSFRICSDHFDADEMMHDGRKIRLFPTAEPKFLLKKFRKVKKKRNDAVPKKFRLPNHYCRLCAEAKKDVISIYGWRGKTTYDLEKKLKYFPFTIEKCDILPLGVCQDCIVKVDQFAKFVETCIEAQSKLKYLLDNKMDYVPVPLDDPIEEILADSLVVSTQETQKVNPGKMNTSLHKTQTISQSEEQIKNVNEVQSPGTYIVQIQNVNNPQNTDLGYIQSFDGIKTTSVNETQSESFFEIQSTGLSEAQTTMVYEIQEINEDLSQLLNCYEIQTTDVNETLNTSCAITFQPLPDVPEHNLNSYLHFDEIIWPELYESLMSDSVEEMTQTEKNCPEPVPDVMKLSVEDLITLYGANDNDLTLHTDPNLSSTSSDVPTSDQFAPPQMVYETAIKNTNFDNIEKFTCDICCNDFATSEMLSSHLKAHCVQSNDNFEIYTTLDFCPDFYEEISRKAKDLDCGIDVSNTEPHASLKEELQNAESPPQKNKSSLKGKKKVRRKLKTQCEFCEKLFPTLAECQEHEKTHQGIRRYVCLKCNKTYRSKKGLRRHFQVHSGETFPCPKCEVIFRRKDSLLNHKKIHQRLTCTRCNFVFKQKAEFLKHKKEHEVLADLPTELHDEPQKEFCEPDLPDLISERDLPAAETLNEFLVDTEPVQQTYIAISNEFALMNDIEQIVANGLIAMEI